MKFHLFKDKKKENRKYTNCYLSNSDLEDQFIKNQFDDIIVQPNGIFLLEKTRYNFSKLLFFSKDIKKIDWTVISDKKLTLSILLRKSKLDNWKSIFDKIKLEGKFKSRGKYVRMTIPLSEQGFELEPSKAINNPVDYELDELQKLLEENFDIYAEYIPSLNDLKDFQASTYIIKESNKIAAFAICQNIGTTKELRFLLVLKEHRGKGYGNLLMKYCAAADKSINRFFLWVNTENKEAINLYKKLGFTEDDILNYILINDNIEI